MEWVVAVIGVGCIFFAFRVVMEYFKYRALATPKIKRLEAAKVHLQTRIDVAKAELGQSRGDLAPLKGEIDKLEQEHQALQDQIVQERSKNVPRSTRFRS